MMLIESDDVGGRDAMRRVDYDGFGSALIDAERVASALVDQLDGQLVVPAHELEFLARRVRDLVGVCRSAFQGGDPT